MRTRDDFIPMVALSLRRKQDNAHTIYQDSLTTINKKIAGDARCGKRTEFSLGSSILSLAILPIFFSALQRITVRLAIHKDRFRL